MQKIQVLFPEPLMSRLRALAAELDQPVSEVVRRATESWLERRAYVAPRAAPPKLPSFKGGAIKVDATKLHELAYADRT